jgi:hypothetical protein
MGGAVTWTETVAKRNNVDGDAPDTRTIEFLKWAAGGARAYQHEYDTNTASGSDTLQTSTLYYDDAGTLTSAYIGDGRARWVYLVNDADGRVLQRNEEDGGTGGDPRELHYYFNGRRVGDISNNGTSNTDYAQSIQDHTVVPTVTSAFRASTTTSVPYADFDQSYDAINGFS